MIIGPFTDICLLEGIGAVVLIVPVVHEEINCCVEFTGMSNAEFRLIRGTKGLFILQLRSLRDCEGKLRGMVPDTTGNPPISRRGGSGGGDRSRGGSIGASGAWRTCKMVQMVT